MSRSWRGETRSSVEAMVMEKVLSFYWYRKISKVIRTSILCLLWCTSWCTLRDFLDYSETSLCISMVDIHSVGPVYFSWDVQMREELYFYNSFIFSDSGKQSNGGSKFISGTMPERNFSLMCLLLSPTIRLKRDLQFRITG